MRIDTLSFKFKTKVTAAEMYQVLLAEQQKFFQSKDPSVSQLEKGSEIQHDIFTKTEKLPVPAAMRITELVPDKCLQLETSYDKGTILQTYEFSQGKEKAEVRYSERNEFNQPRYQFSFLFISIFYKVIYNHGIKKRMQYIEQLCQENH
ncbi:MULTISPECIES: DUF3284 domain-containing protein [Enterococcus]|uniref:DUF3284 domain-containing protein n=1 Tax=Enterococcus TaxID=1350 RepID=UPI00065E57D7|nr:MULTISPECIES: DUF3284 domain-containing protein [Enterococcus]KAF1301626.1 hypothetical protein BAU16_08875 [Enterococcus sp. JM9B]